MWVLCRLYIFIYSCHTFEHRHCLSLNCSLARIHLCKSFQYFCSYRSVRQLELSPVHRSIKLFSPWFRCKFAASNFQSSNESIRAYKQHSPNLNHTHGPRYTQHPVGTALIADGSWRGFQSHMFCIVHCTHVPTHSFNSGYEYCELMFNCALISQG